MSDKLHSKIPAGAMAQKWDNFKADMKLVNPNNKRKFKVLVVGSGLAGGSLCSLLQRTRWRPSARIVVICSSLAMRKLLSGNGCDSQPRSRWTNMPTRSEATSMVSWAVAVDMAVRRLGSPDEACGLFRHASHPT